MTKFYSQFKQVKEIFEKALIKVIAPIIDEVDEEVSKEKGGIISKGDDKSKSLAQTEANFF
jgi:hypothetical protein